MIEFCWFFEIFKGDVFEKLVDGKVIISILYRVLKYLDGFLMDFCSGDGGYRELRILFEEKKWVYF